MRLPISSRLSPWLRLHAWWPVPAERRAETLLRDMLSQEEYRHLLTLGFLEFPARRDRIGSTASRAAQGRCWSRSGGV